MERVPENHMMNRRAWRGRFVKFIAALMVLFAVLEGVQLSTENTFLTSSLAHAVFRHNLHEVRSGKFYRAGEMSREELGDTIRDFNIKTVVDLRAGTKNSTDSTGERLVVEESGAKYYRMPLLGSRMPTRAEIRRMLRIYDKALEPILVHCTSGTHRSGVASAVWLLTKGGSTPQEASQQLSVKYGFFKLERALKSYFKQKPTIDNLIWDYLDAYAERPTEFRHWVAKQYRPEIPADVPTEIEPQAHIENPGAAK